MPYLKFSRDRRGYESTYLLQAGRRQGSERPRLLYWFRTPPHVKVGRAAFDEEAIRALEEHHPDLAFDWKHILQARPPAAPETREREGRPQRKPERGERKGREARRPAADKPRPAEAASPSPERVPEPEEIAAPGPADVESVTDVTPAPAEAVTEVAARTPVEPAFEPPAPRRRLVRVYDVDSSPAPPIEHRATDPPMANQVLGDEAAELLRARHAELLARIATRVADPARAEALREQAERLNPDTWVTEADVRTGAAQAEGLHEELRRLIGGRRRRRRRGRSRDAGAGRPDQPQTEPSDDRDDREEQDPEDPEDDAGAGDPDVS